MYIFDGDIFGDEGHEKLVLEAEGNFRGALNAFLIYRGVGEVFVHVHHVNYANTRITLALSLKKNPALWPLSPPYSGGGMGSACGLCSIKYFGKAFTGKQAFI